jgi:cysteinyl-tRNA synthetase, unknown class
MSNNNFFHGLILLALSGCHKEKTAPAPNDLFQEVNYRNEMRQFVIGISTYARGIDQNFIIIPQNGQELCTTDGSADGTLETAYLDAIDGQGREELYYGFDNNDDEATPSEYTENWKPYLDRMHENGTTILVTDYCSSALHVDQSTMLNESSNFLSFAANARDLNLIPNYPALPTGYNNAAITSMEQANNFLYIINPDQYTNKNAFLNALARTNYDIIIMDAFFDDQPFDPSDLEQIRYKSNGGQRLLIAYMSIGEAEDYRFYWDNEWTLTSPEWLGSNNPDWPGNYKVEYWNPNWQSIIYGNQQSYTHQILEMGFDGAYLDIIDAFEYFEEGE